VVAGVVARRVQSHEPVALAPAPRRRVQGVVVGKGPQAAERIADRGLGQRAEPEPPGRLAHAPGQLQDVAEDQLALAAGVGGADQMVRGAEEALDDRELLSCTLLLEELESKSL